MATPNEQLRDAFIRHQIGLLRLATGVSRRTIELLDDSESRLRVLIERYFALLSDPRVNWSSRTVQARLARMREQIQELRFNAMRDAQDELEEESRGTVIAAWAFMGTAVATVTDGEQKPAAPGGRREARRMVNDVPFEGRTLRQWMNDLAATDAARISNSVVVGLMQGRSRREILTSILGRARLNGADGIVHRTRRDLESLVRTALTHFNAQAVHEFENAHEDLFPRDLFVAVLDGRTTAICRSLDGDVFPRGKGPIPPLHWRCRSIRVALLSGPVPKRMNYESWLKSQSAAFQDDVLGKAKGALFRRGGLPLDRFVDGSGREFTLKELVQHDRQAFKAAGLDPDRWSD